jgi:hypothetical protein
MTRLASRVGLTALVFATIVVLGTAAAPVALACYCQPPASLVDGLGDRTAVVVGRVEAVDAAGRQVLSVERWFRGPQPTRVLVIHEGGVARTDCDLVLPAGARIVVAAPQDGASLQAFLCSPIAEVGSDRGRAWIAEAERAFGPGLDATGVTQAAAAGPLGVDAPLWWAVGVLVAFGLGVALGVAVVRWRRRRP